MKLLIVESPTKAKKLRQLLGRDWRVAASFGHVRDLPTSGDLAVRFVSGRVEPQYETLERAQQAIGELRGLLRQAETVALATDPDREGEAIAWHLAELLALGAQAQRVTFNAITAAAVAKAVASPRPLDLRLVGAQQARRVLDRVVGWVVSPTLRRGTGEKAARSAGRVQSVALRLVAEREREIQAFTVTRYFTLDAWLEAPGQPPPFTARLVEWKGEALGTRLAEADLAERTAVWCRRQAWQVASVDRREVQRRPPPPFVTATVQQAASVRLKQVPQQTMKLLQELFENGHITYHRTDSVQVEPEAIAAARAIIAQRYAPEYLPAKPVQHEGKAANTQEAHEAIRPTHPESGPTALGDDPAGQLYRLIWERFIASQMAPGRDFLSTLRIAIAAGSFQHHERGRLPMGLAEAKGRVVLFDGWRRLTDDSTDEKKSAKKKKKDEADEYTDTPLPDLAVGTALNLLDLAVAERSTKAPPRYTQASLIKKLEQLGIGRPSTYAATLATLLERQYVEESKRMLTATALGLLVIDWLTGRFAGNFIDIDYTARMEERLDAIARGEEDWQAATTEASRAVTDLAMQAGLGHDPLSGEAPPDPRAPAAEAGPCPLCSSPMARRISRFGPFFVCLGKNCAGMRDGDGRPSRKTEAELRRRQDHAG